MPDTLSEEEIADCGRLCIHVDDCPVHGVEARVKPKRNALTAAVEGLEGAPLTPERIAEIQERASRRAPAPQSEDDVRALLAHNDALMAAVRKLLAMLGETPDDELRQLAEGEQ